jgi:hypothetical protein
LKKTSPIYVELHKRDGVEVVELESSLP